MEGTFQLETNLSINRNALMNLINRIGYAGYYTMVSALWTSR